MTRRAFLAAAAAGTAACTSRPARPPADPDAAAVAFAREGELRLLAGFSPGTGAYDTHAAHLRALGGALPTPTPQPVPPTARSVAAAERESVPLLQAAAVAARRGSTAATLASIAASHAVLGGAQPGL